MSPYPAVLAMLLAAAAPAAAEEPLFAADGVVAITLTGPFRQIARQAPRSTEPHPGTLVVGNETLPVALSARGLSRRQGDICDFPPLRVAFPNKPAAPSLFKGQAKLKLVTHCKDSARYETQVLREYLAYRLYNRLTPASFRVRLAQLRYTEPDGKPFAQRYGFFIEDIDEVAKRVGGKEVKLNGVPQASLDAEAGARVALFQFLIGNLDWAILKSPAGASCCHNSKLLAQDPARPANAVPVPYDFDFSGLVDAPYATVPEGMRDQPVTRRLYRGLCRHNGALPAQVEAFRAARPALEAEIAATPGLPPATRQWLSRYLSAFYDDIGDAASMERNLVRNCR